MSYWEHFPHGSDIGVRGVGGSVAQAFEMAGVALTALMAAPTAVAPVEAVEFEISAENLDFLFFEWLNRVVYETAARKTFFSEFHVKIAGQPPQLSARMLGEKINVEKHQPGVEVKGATFTELKVEQQEDHWVCQCVVDV